MDKQVSRAVHLLIFVLVVVLLGTCASSMYSTGDGPAVAPAVMALEIPAIAMTPVEMATLTPAPSVLPAFDTERDTGTSTDWSLVRPGLERRVIPVYDRQNLQVESLHVWRLDQNYFRMDIAYADSPKSLETWQRETNALMVVNGGFYSIENERYFPDGLTIVNGAASEHGLNGFDGLLAIRDSGTEVRWLDQKPYDPAEPLHAALQSFPILVEPGGGLGYGPERESNASARRTVIAQDKDGRVLFIIAPQGYFTLHQLSAYLTESDLDLDIALNLDGGGSTGILVADPPEVISPTRPIPFVILVYAR
jgi:hypothetical protein